MDKSKRIDRIVNGYEEGTNVGEYCKRNKISRGQYYYWRKRIEAQNREKGNKFVEIQGIAERKNQVIEMRTVKGTIFRFEPGISLDVMKELSQM